jgi:hypothetical protein
MVAAVFQNLQQIDLIVGNTKSITNAVRVQCANGIVQFTRHITHLRLDLAATLSHLSRKSLGVLKSLVLAFRSSHCHLSRQGFLVLESLVFGIGHLHRYTLV